MLEIYSSGVKMGKFPIRGYSHFTQSPRGGGFRNDYANVIFALSNNEFDYGRGEGSRNRQKVIA